MHIDLHTHSTASDGTDSPGELVASAGKAGLDVVALTDHDTTAGWTEASAALPSGLTLVPGAELSCMCDDGSGRRISVHLLGYLFDPQATEVVAEQQRLRSERRTRLRTMAERMAADGLPVDPEDVLGSLPVDSSAGRPHLAQALVKAGLVDTVDEAFGRYLGNGRSYYMPRSDTPVETAIDMITAAGGVTVFAHPFAFSRGPTVAPRVLGELAERGLVGVEADHPNHDAAAREQLRVIAREHGLVVTGSSDYHGTNKTIGLGQETTDQGAFEALCERASGARVRVG